MDIFNFFEARAALFSEKEVTERKKSRRVSNLRLFFFLLFAGILAGLFYQKQFALIFFFLPFFLLFYGWLVVKHRKINEAWVLFQLLVKINQEELDRKKGYINAFPPGESFKNNLHPYAKDLDLFGKSSLFQYLNRCSTEGGTQKLAAWLCEPAERGEILLRQEAVKELATNVDFRQHLQASGRKLVFSLAGQKSLEEWATKEHLLHFGNLKILLYMLNGFTLGSLGALILGFSGKFLFFSVVLNVLFVSLTRKKVLKLFARLDANAPTLKVAARFLRMIESLEVTSEKLRGLKQLLASEGLPASEKIRKLAFRMEMLEYGKNPYFYLVANFTFLWDLHWAFSIEAWQRKFNGEPEYWFECLNEFEALSSLAGSLALNPEWIFPEIVSDGFVYQADNLAHPLLFGKGVSNSFPMHGESITWILTGSNMSGKSTFLRTLGINAVLAFSGAPVNASFMKISVFQVFTSMRTEDSLEASTSSFYAELKRIRQLFDSLSSDKTVFYLLDEILKGTNSADRHAGGMAIVKQLQGKNASGIIATHDIELGKLEEEFPTSVFNYHFSSRLENGELLFDYRLKPGICESFNASELMRQMGIQL